MLRHGYAAEVLRDAIILPIRKGNKDPTSSSNYRGIALASSLSKLLELCILLVYPDSFLTSELQFGFKQGYSADLCTGLLKLVASKYVNHGSKVFCALLDASKAFDTVDHRLLFQKLLTRNLSTPIVRFLLKWYSSQLLRIRWNDKLSEPFGVTNGVRQGGILSPISYTLNCFSGWRTWELVAFGEASTWVVSGMLMTLL